MAKDDDSDSKDKMVEALAKNIQQAIVKWTNGVYVARLTTALERWVKDSDDAALRKAMELLPSDLDANTGLPVRKPTEDEKDAVLAFRSKIRERLLVIQPTLLAFGPNSMLDEENFTKRVQEIKAYKELHGDLPQMKKKREVMGEADYSLAIFVKQLRGDWKSLAKKRQGHNLTPNRIKQLDDIKFCWESPEECRRRDMQERLTKYQKVHGDCWVTKEYPVLYEWAQTQRKNKKNGKCSQEEEAFLNSLGFCWDLDEGRWEKRYQEVVAYKKAHGNCQIPRGPLYCWFIAQKRESKTMITRGGAPYCPRHAEKITALQL
jgi:hypothetical protein